MDETKKSSARTKKELTIESLAEKFTSAKSIVLADYQGLNVSAFTEVKNKLEEDKAEFTVAKNTLLKLAAKKAGLEIPAEALEGPTAALFAYGDEITPIKDLAKLAKQYEKPTPKAGFLGTQFLSADRIKQLALLPSKLELQAKVVGSLNSPIYGIVSVLHANIRNLVYVLSQVNQSKGGAS
ncbi:MAG: 50S ribosomal protein L10 [Candidatus Woykebacteria bacterium]